MRICLLVTVATLALGRDSLLAQDLSMMVQAIPVVTRADPTATRSALTEGYLSQPMIMAHGSVAWLQARATLNLEGLTLQRGELNTGGYGEGYVDRRHPHAYVHELLLGAEHTFAGVDASVFGGRGFAPFGSDDPMTRPFEKYPVNHHLSQVLERVVAIAALRKGPVTAEVGTFNGDEPTGPSSSPNYDRFGDSWATRLTIAPLDGLEVSGSLASVTSPELRVGHGLDQRKSSVVVRFNRETPTSWRYAFAEYAHTNERDQGETATSLSTMLAEAAYCAAGVVVATRIERTDRPEEEQLADPFRTPRPSLDLSNLGISRWTTLTGSVSAPAVHFGVASARPFVEVARVAVSSGNPAGVFNPQFRYGANRMWMVSAGVRLRAGSMHDRMGRYGAALPPMESMSSMHGGGTHPQQPEAEMNMPGMSHPSASVSAAASSQHSAGGRCVL
jgi:hypothetical protein